MDPRRLRTIDVEPVKLRLNPKVWVTELLWAALLDSAVDDSPPWIVGGDMNASETFDHMHAGGPRGNREFLDRVLGLGLTECLRHWNGALVPTFGNPRGGKAIHQVDHPFVSAALRLRLVSCTAADETRVFGASLSDHLPVVADLVESNQVAG